MKRTILLIAILSLLSACTPQPDVPATVESLLVTNIAETEEAITATQAQRQTQAALPTDTPAPTPTFDPCSPEALAPWWDEIQPVREATIAAAEEFFIGVARGGTYTEAELQAVLLCRPSRTDDDTVLLPVRVRM